MRRVKQLNLNKQGLLKKTEKFVEKVFGRKRIN